MNVRHASCTQAVGDMNIDGPFSTIIRYKSGKTMKEVILINKKNWQFHGV